MVKKFRFEAFQIWIWLFIFCPNTYAGLEDLPIGARSLAMGGTYVALANTADAVFLNPGGLSQIVGFEFSLFYQKPFGLPDLHFGTLAMHLPFRSHHFGLGVSTFGNEIYAERMFIFSYSHRFQKLHLGVALRYQSVEISNYGAAGTPGFDLGLVAPLSGRMQWGFFASNLNRPAIGDTKERLPQSFVTGISIRPNSLLILNVEVFKDVRFPQEVRFGAEIKALQPLAFRVGTADNPSRFSAGFGLRISKFNIDYAFFTHNDLGLTHQMSFSIAFGKNSEMKNIEKETPVAEADEGKREVNGKKAEVSADRQSLTSVKKVNINTASRDELTALPGIGPTLAERIVSYRKQNGPFQTLEQLLNVRGIGKRKLEKLKPEITLGRSAQK